MEVIIDGTDRHRPFLSLERHTRSLGSFAAYSLNEQGGAQANLSGSVSGSVSERDCELKHEQQNEQKQKQKHEYRRILPTYN